MNTLNSDIYSLILWIKYSLAIASRINTNLFSRLIYMADNLCYIKTKNSLKKREKRQNIKQAIKEKFMSTHEHSQLRQNGTFQPELIALACNCVENCIKKHAGIDKKAFVIEIIEDIFPSLSIYEKEYIS